MVNPQMWQFVTIGLIAGVAGGMFGIGGGAVMVPAMALCLGIELKNAIGTSLGAQLLPVGILAVIGYHQEKLVNVRWALLLAAGLLVGTLLGQRIASPMEPATMKKMYGAFMILIGVRYLVFK